MNDSLSEHTEAGSLTRPSPGVATGGEGRHGVIDADEPLWALATGALLGGAAFWLSALWLGPNIGIAAALVAAIITAARRELPEAATFVAAAALSAAAFRASHVAILLSALCFASGLALSVRRRRAATATVRS